MGIVGKNVSKGLDFFSPLSSGSSLAKRLFQVFVWGFGSFAVWKSQAQEDECKVVYQHGFMEVHRGGKNTLNCYLHMFKSTQIHVAESNGIVKWSQCQQISMDLTPGDGEGIDADAAT